MKKLMIISTALLFMAGYAVNAQTGHDHNNNKQDQNQKQGMMMQDSGMMQGGMMQGMMQDGMCPMCGQLMNQEMPMQKYGMMVNKLPTMQEQLSLTDAQVNQLYDLQTDFKKQEIDYQSELRKKQMKLKGLLNDMAPATQVKKQMLDCADTKINMKVAAYETAGKMKALLTNDQKEKMKTMMMQMQGQGGMMNQGQGGMMQNQNNQ